VRTIFAGVALLVGAVWVGRRAKSHLDGIEGFSDDAVDALSNATWGLYPVADPENIQEESYASPDYSVTCRDYSGPVGDALKSSRAWMQTQEPDSYALQATAIQFWSLGLAEGCDDMPDLEAGDLVYLPR
jgi:hypothetical protein